MKAKNFNQFINDLVENKSERKSFDNVIETSQTLDRNLYLGEIEEGTGSLVDTAIRFWNKADNENDTPIEEREPIKIYIDSPGGDLSSTLTIIDAIRLSKTPVWTINVGTAYSGGFFSFISGHRRFAYPSSSFLFHEGSAGTSGTANQFENYASFYKRRLNALKEIVLSHTKISEEKYTSIQKDDFWMTAEDAIELGCADEIITELI